MTRAALYARLSVSTDVSVSIERQLKACREFAEHRGWDIVLEAVDDGVSASKYAPDSREGWREILANLPDLDIVVIWRTDRLARRVLDLALATEALTKAEVGLTSTDNAIDTSTAPGRAMAQFMAVIAELEVSQTSDRVRASRTTLINNGRRAGGRPPFGWMNVANPHGPGKVLAKDPDRIWVVEELVDRLLAGASIYSLVRWLEESEIRPRARRRSGRASDAPVEPEGWHAGSVEAILRNPVLAGMTVHHGDVIRHEDGTERIDESVAIITADQHHQILGALDARRASPRPWGSHIEPALLSGLLRCGTCVGPLHRATSNKGRYREYRCANRRCAARVAIKRGAIEEHVIADVLRRFGSEYTVEVTAHATSPDNALREIEAAISQTLELMRLPGADVMSLATRLEELKQRATELRGGSRAATTYRLTPTTLASRWHAAADDAERNRLLAGRIAHILVEKRENARGKPFDPTRVTIVCHDLDATEIARQREMLDLVFMRSMNSRFG